jgi:hypothetical protein
MKYFKVERLKFNEGISDLFTQDSSITDSKQFLKSLEDFVRSKGNIQMQTGGVYKFSTLVQCIQIALIYLGFKLPNAGADGKYGPETATAISQFNEKTLPDESSKQNESIKKFIDFHLNEADVYDISSDSTYNARPLKDNNFFIIHHTAGHGSAQGVVRVLNNRGLGIQWVVDLEGRIFRTLPANSRGAHTGKTNKMPMVLNGNSQGVEVVAKDDKDIKAMFDEDMKNLGYPRQAEAVRRIIKYLGYEKNQIFGHGEITTNKQATEGKTIKEYVLANWDKPAEPIRGNDIKAGAPIAGSSVKNFITNINFDLVERLITELKKKRFSQENLEQLLSGKIISKGEDSPVSTNKGKVDIVFVCGVYNGKFKNPEEQKKLLQSGATGKQIEVFKWDTEREQAKQLLKANPNAKLVLFSQACKYVLEFLPIVKNASNIYVVEPYCVSTSHKKAVQDATKQGLPESNVLVGPNLGVGLGTVPGETKLKRSSHWEALVKVGGMLK